MTKVLHLGMEGSDVHAFDVVFVLRIELTPGEKFARYRYDDSATYYILVMTLPLSQSGLDCDLSFLCVAGFARHLPVYRSPWPVCLAGGRSDGGGH